MKKVLILVSAVVLTLGAAAEKAAAQKFELGVRAGVASQNMDMEFAGLQDAKARLGWHAAAVSRIRIVGFGDGLLGAGLFFQPEVVYSQNSLKATTVYGGITPAMVKLEPSSSKIRMQTVDVPLMLSLKVSIARVHAGPVFHLMNNFTSNNGNLEIQHPLRSAVGYALGASVDLLGLTIDGRYYGDFGKLKSNINASGYTHESVKSSLSSWSLGVGIMF